MKRIIVFSCAALLLATSGCGTFQKRSVESEDLAVVKEEQSDETVYNEINQISEDTPEEDIVCDVDNLSEEQQRMYGPMGALIYCYESDSATSHKWADAGWGTLSTLANDFYTMEDAGTRAYGDANDHTLILGSFLKECASAMYADFNGELPPIPSSDNIVAWGIQGEQGEYYIFHYGDRGMDSHDFIITSWIEHADSSCTVEMQEWTWEPENLAAIYDFELVENGYDESQTDPYFIYSVASVKKNNEKTEAWLAEHPADNNDYILPDSDSRYYTESELDGLTKDELRLARNEIYARHGRKFDAEDLREYFNGKAWYNGTIEPSDFSDSVFNEYEKANISTIEAVENAADGNVNNQSTTAQNTTGTAVPSGFTFADISGIGFVFASGAGAWGTELDVYSDGTFSGVYSDWNGGEYDETHPGGEYWYSEFSGKFSEPKKVDDYTYSVTVESLNLTYEPDTSEIKDELLYNYTDPYGISLGNEFFIYLPGTPIGEVPEAYVEWRYGSASNAPSVLSSYSLYNASESTVFY